MDTKRFDFDSLDNIFIEFDELIDKSDGYTEPKLNDVPSIEAPEQSEEIFLVRSTHKHLKEKEGTHKADNVNNNSEAKSIPFSEMLSDALEKHTRSVSSLTSHAISKDIKPIFSKDEIDVKTAEKSSHKSLNSAYSPPNFKSNNTNQADSSTTNSSVSAPQSLNPIQPNLKVSSKFENQFEKDGANSIQTPKELHTSVSNNLNDNKNSEVLQDGAVAIAQPKLKTRSFRTSTRSMGNTAAKSYTLEKCNSNSENKKFTLPLQTVWKNYKNNNKKKITNLSESSSSLNLVEYENSIENLANHKQSVTHTENSAIQNKVYNTSKSQSILQNTDAALAECKSDYSFSIPKLNMQFSLPNIQGKTYLSVCISNGEHQVVLVDQSQSIQSVLEKVCSSRSLFPENCIVYESDNKAIPPTKTVQEIKSDSIRVELLNNIGRHADTPCSVLEILAKLHSIFSSLSLSLIFVQKNYQYPLFQNDDTKTTGKTKELKTNQFEYLFEYLPFIINTCKSLGQCLSSLRSTASTSMYDFFMIIDSSVHILDEYFDRQYQMISSMEEMRNNKIFSDYVNQIKKSTGCKLDLEDLMCLFTFKFPTIMKYLEIWIHLLDKDHLDCTQLVSIYQQLEPYNERARILTELFKMKKKTIYLENHVLKLRKRIRLWDERRRYFCEGLLEVVSKKSKLSQVRAFLFTDVIVLCRPRLSSKTKGMTWPMVFEDVITFLPKETVVEHLADQESRDFCISIGRKEVNKVYCRIIDSPDNTMTREMWISTIKEATLDFAKKSRLCLSHL